MPQYGRPYAGGCLHCDSCGYDTINEVTIATNRTEVQHGVD